MLVTRWNSLVALYSLHNLLVTRCRSCFAKNHPLLVAEIARSNKSLVTRCKVRSLLIVEVASFKKSLVTHCKIHSLLVAEIARGNKSFVTRCNKSPVTRCKIRSLLFAKDDVTHCKICLLLVEEVARCKKSLVTRCKIRSLLVIGAESACPTLLKSDSSTGVFLWIFVKFLWHLSGRTSANGCFWK